MRSSSLPPSPHTGTSLSGPFVFDDTASIVENPTIRHLWPIGPVLTPPYVAAETVGGRPVLNLSFAINYLFGGASPLGYHALKGVVHALAGLILFGVLRRTLELPAMRSVAEKLAPESILFALATALLWAVHSLQTESVTYAAQRAESLMGLLYLLTLYCFIRYAGGGIDRDSKGPGVSRAGSRVWAALAVAACLLGMGTKEVMVSAPAIVFLYDRIFVSGRFREAWRRHW